MRVVVEEGYSEDLKKNAAAVREGILSQYNS